MEPIQAVNFKGITSLVAETPSLLPIATQQYGTFLASLNTQNDTENNNRQKAGTKMTTQQDSQTQKVDSLEDEIEILAKGLLTYSTEHPDATFSASATERFLHNIDAVLERMQAVINIQDGQRSATGLFDNGRKESLILKSQVIASIRDDLRASLGHNSNAALKEAPIAPVLAY